MIEYRAAHSMDTNWFAVDRDGYVAIFDSGDAGAMPVNAAAWDGSEDTVDPSIFPRRTAGWVHDSVAFRDPEVGQHCNPDRGDTADWMEILMFLESLDPIRPELACAGGKVVPANGSAAVYWRSIPVELFQPLHENGTCLHCRYCYHRAADPEEEPGSYRNALFVYNHHPDAFFSGPYGRTCLPAEPMHVSELASERRQRLERCRFEDLSFQEDAVIQPLEHAQCTSLQFAWLSSDRKTIHPITGEEERYRAHYVELVSDPWIQGRFRVDPPAPPAEPDSSEHLESSAVPQNGGDGL